MISHYDNNGVSVPDPGYSEPPTHQRSPRTDPDLRDGDSGRGNPLESGSDEVTTDNDVGDTHPTAVADRDDTSGRPAAEPDTEIDRSREEVVGSGMVEAHGPASLAGGERT